MMIWVTYLNDLTRFRFFRKSLLLVSTDFVISDEAYILPPAASMLKI